MMGNIEFNLTEFQKYLFNIAQSVLDTNSKCFEETCIRTSDPTLIETVEFHMAGSTSKLRYLSGMDEKVIYLKTQEVLEWYQENVLSQTPNR